jgi:hypothetical protein
MLICRALPLCFRALVLFLRRLVILSGFLDFLDSLNMSLDLLDFRFHWILDLDSLDIEKRKLIDTGFYFLVLFLGIGWFGFSDIGY